MFGKKRSSETKMPKLERVPVHTAVNVALDRARTGIEDHNEYQAYIARLESDRIAAVESGNVGELIRIGAELEIARHVLPKKLTKAWDALDSINAARVEAVRGTVARLRAEAVEIDREEERILAQYGRLQGVDYGPTIGRSQPIGAWEPTIVFPVDLKNGHPAHRYALTNDARYAETKSDKLKREAAELERQAAELAARFSDRTGDPNAAFEALEAEISAEQSRATQSAEAA
jgi:hypothetical protein